MAAIGKDLEKVIDLLMTDEVVAIPTETVYGLAGNALSENAVRKIFEVKGRPLTDPLIVHLPSVESIELYVKELPSLAVKLFETFSPGPLTILLPKSNLISDLVTNGSQNVAIRIPNHPLTLKLLREIPFPLVAPSANPFGQLSPTLPVHVEASLGQLIPYILDGGSCQIGLESTIVQITDDNKIRVLRQGGISEESLLLVAQLFEETENPEKEIVPGSMKSHYAPSIPLKIGLVSDDLQKYKVEEIAFLGFDDYNEDIPKKNQLLLSPTGDLNEAARKLFSSLHILEQMPVKIIITAFLPNKGIGKAINERLKRASAKREN